MNSRREPHKLVRKNKKSQRQLKHLNSDYYIKGMNPDKNTATSSNKCTKINQECKSHRKYSTNSSSELVMKKSTSKKKAMVQLNKIERTRSSTILNKRKTKENQRELAGTQNLLEVYSRIESVLEAYQTRIISLEEQNKKLSKQNIRLRTMSCSNYR